MLKEAFALADKEGYRFGGVKKKANKQKAKSRKQKSQQNHRHETSTILLPGILHENSNTGNDDTELANDSDDEVINEGSTCDVDASAFHPQIQAMKRTMTCRRTLFWVRIGLGIILKNWKTMILFQVQKRLTTIIVRMV